MCSLFHTAPLAVWACETKETRYLLPTPFHVHTIPWQDRSRGKWTPSMSYWSIAFLKSSLAVVGSFLVRAPMPGNNSNGLSASSSGLWILPSESVFLCFFFFFSWKVTPVFCWVVSSYCVLPVDPWGQRELKQPLFTLLCPFMDLLWSALESLH